MPRQVGTVVLAILASALVTCRAVQDGATPPRANAPGRGEASASSAPSAQLSASTSAAPPVVANAVPEALPPLTNVDWIEELPLEGEGVAYVTPPVGARERRPLIVGVHGAGDRPEWSCGGWRLAASGYAFVVCPQGLKMDAQRFAWDRPATIARRVDAALRAVHARFGRYIAEGPTLYAGFSQGATLAEAALLAKPDRYAVVALAEGAYELVSDDAFLTRLRETGTTRLAFICGNPSCFRSANAARSRVEQKNIELVVAGDPLAGHNLNQRMQTALHAAWPAIVAGLPNWRDAPAPRQR